MASAEPTPTIQYVSQQYGDNVLQQVGIWEMPQQRGGYWIVYIHGGAWRDPKITHLTFLPTVDQLLSAGRLPPNSIAGFASIDYRLSPHPDHPQDPAATPTSELRQARHPDHIRDVQAALRFLSREHGVKEDKYILVGHSAGATLAMQLLMDPSSRAPERAEEHVPLPAAIVGVSGIYDLVGLDERHDGNYTGFITSAFGSDRKIWDVASPVNFTGNFQTNWPNAKLAVLAWSREDTLIDEPEIDKMAAKLIKDRLNVSVTKSLTGEHDDVWGSGQQLARLIVLTLAQIRE
ncbi:Alpha/Beta hydrolase protein [Emericellopsis atlantica]|uniref:Kynurenine formamidase n=1 Tax=Emericellopsis atlantica TaxID=2614577 RepID=A0A9P8CQG9_9HYPO|nr:Alpha/Beta hydrolase protein [Emericellopsis atlantica]KAG9255297.1 Alpha/Beta hydrolase protein [Emericellopsis atlantica]